MQYHVSALLLFRDDEDHIGTAIENVVHCLRSQALRFELIAVDAGSRDNSVALLSVARARFPEVRIVAAPNPRRAHEYAADLAEGEVLWLLSPAAAADKGADQAFARSFFDVYQLVKNGQEAMVTSAEHGVTDHGLVAERAHLRRAVRGLRSHGRGLPLGLKARARLMRSHANSRRDRLARRLHMGRWVGPLMSVLSVARFQ